MINNYPFPVLTPSLAEEAEYVSLTRPYNLHSPDEATWFDRACAQLRGINCCVVEFTDGVEIWRHRSGVRTDKKGRHE